MAFTRSLARRWRRLIALAGALALVAVSGVPTAASATVGQAMWFPASGGSGTTGQAVQVAVHVVTGYTGGTVGGLSVPWVEVPDYLIAAMEAQAGLSDTPAGWYVPSLKAGQYGLVTAMKYGGVTFDVGGAPTPSSSEWTTAKAWTETLDNATGIVYPSTQGTVTDAQASAPDSLSIPHPIGDNVVAGADGRSYVTYDFGSQATTVPAGWYAGDNAYCGGTAPSEQPGGTCHELYPSQDMYNCMTFTQGPVQAPGGGWYRPSTMTQTVFAATYDGRTFGSDVTLVNGTCSYK